MSNFRFLSTAIKLIVKEYLIIFLIYAGKMMDIPIPNKEEFSEIMTSFKNDDLDKG